MLNSFFARLDEILAEWGRPKEVWFRGHSDREYVLSPGLFRGLPEHSKISIKDKAERLKIEENVFRLYRQISRRIMRGVEADSIWEDLFNMQHYGLPTRLLDWSTAPGIALYFASDYSPDTDPEIWVLHPAAMNNSLAAALRGSKKRQLKWLNEERVPYEYELQANVDYEKFLADAHKYYQEAAELKSVLEDTFELFTDRPLPTMLPVAALAVNASYCNDRIFSQRGAFTIHRDSRPLESIAGSEAWVRRIPFDDCGDRDEIESYLQISNINEVTIFSDFTRASHFIKKAVGLGAHCETPESGHGTISPILFERLTADFSGMGEHGKRHEIYTTGLFGHHVLILAQVGYGQHAPESLPSKYIALVARWRPPSKRQVLKPMSSSGANKFIEELAAVDFRHGISGVGISQKQLDYQELEGFMKIEFTKIKAKQQKEAKLWLDSQVKNLEVLQRDSAKRAKGLGDHLTEDQASTEIERMKEQYRAISYEAQYMGLVHVWGRGEPPPRDPLLDNDEP